MWQGKTMREKALPSDRRSSHHALVCVVVRARRTQTTCHLWSHTRWFKTRRDKILRRPVLSPTVLWPLLIPLPVSTPPSASLLLCQTLTDRKTHVHASPPPQCNTAHRFNTVNVMTVDLESYIRGIYTQKQEVFFPDRPDIGGSPSSENWNKRSPSVQLFCSQATPALACLQSSDLPTIDGNKKKEKSNRQHIFTLKYETGNHNTVNICEHQCHSKLLFYRFNRCEGSPSSLTDTQDNPFSCGIDSLYLPFFTEKSAPEERLLLCITLTDWLTHIRLL